MFSNNEELAIEIVKMYYSKLNFSNLGKFEDFRDEFIQKYILTLLKIEKDKKNDVY